MLAGGLHEHAAELLPTDRVLLYDPAEDDHACFITLPNLPLPLAGVALVYDDIGDRVFACGGQTDTAFAGRPNVITGNLFGQVLAFNFESVSIRFLSARTILNSTFWSSILDSVAVMLFPCWARNKTQGKGYVL